MASVPGVNQGKGKFLREFLAVNRDARLEDVTAAWTAEGHDDGISESLINKIRSELGLTGKRGSNGKASEEAATPPAKGKVKSSPKRTKDKGKKSQESPLLPAVQEEATGPSKSSFVGEMLGREPGANLKKINEAWAAAGHEGTISPSIFFKVKRERGVAGEPEVEVASDRAPEPKSPPKGDRALAAASKVKPTPKTSKPRNFASPQSNGEVAAPEPTAAMANPDHDNGRELHEIEGEIDELMFRLKGLGNFAEVQEALRAARRLLVRSHGH